MNENKKRLIVISAPSGGGKTVVARHILDNYSNTCFSVSATTRGMRPGEENGVHYHFLSREEFISRIQAGDLIEYEEIFGNIYGTLKSTIDKAIAEEKVVLFDVDVKGALSLQKAYPEDALLIFLTPPNEEILENRLRSRGTETEEQIQTRLSRSLMEIGQKDEFDYVVVNNVLENTFAEVDAILAEKSTAKR